MKKHQLIAFLLVFAMVASIVCATFVFADAEENDAEMFWLTHYDNRWEEGAGVVFTQPYEGAAWWLHVAFSPIAGAENAYEITEISDGITDGSGTPLAIPEGGFVYGVNTGNDYSGSGGENYVNANCNAMITRARQWKVGDKFVFTGLDLEGKTVPTTTPDKKWYDADYVCTATYAPYVAPEIDPVVYNYLSQIANADTDVYTAQANADGSVTVTLNKDISENVTIATFSDDWTFDASKQYYVVADVATDSSTVNFLMHYTRSDKVADLYWSSMKDTGSYGTYIPFKEGTATTWDITKYLVGKTFPDNMHQIKDLVITGGSAGDVITFNSLALVDDVSTISAGDPLVPAVKYDYLSELASAKSDAATIKANADGSVTVTLNQDISSATTIVSFPDDWKFDASKQYYVAVDAACDNSELNFLMHYTRSDKVADLYWSSMKDTGSYGTYIPFKEGTATTWDITKYLVGKTFPDNMHQIKDLAITSGKAGDVITFKTLALITNVNVVTPGEPLVAGDGKVESTNVALGKEVEIKKAAAIPQYSEADLTDGKIATTMGWGNPTDEWFSFYYNANFADQVNIERVNGMNVGFFVVDLAAYYDVDSVRIHYNKDYLPETTNIYTSKDRKTFTKVHEAAPKAADGEVDGVGCWIDFPLEEVATAQYVKVEFVFSGMFAMLDEVEVYGVATNVENVALGKPYTHSELYPTTDTAQYPDEGGVTLTDGKIAPDDAGYSNAAFMGFNSNADYDGYSWIKVDLGDTYALNELVLYVGGGATNAAAGIKPPLSTTFLVSTDGLNFKEVGKVSPVEDDTTTNSIRMSLVPETAVTARYVLIRNVHASNWMFVSEFEAYGVPADYIPREPAGEIVLDGKLGDSGYDDAEWVEHNLWQNQGAPEPEGLTGKFTTRMDDKYVSITVQIDNTVAPNILPDYASAVAGGLTANGAQTSTYVQTGATTFRLWLRADADERYLIDVQYLGEALGWVATRAIFPTGSSLTWDDLKVIAAVTFDGGVLTAEIAFLKDQFGIDENVAVFVTYSENNLDDGEHTGYQSLHICNPNTTNDNGYIGGGYSGNVTHPYTFYTKEAIAVIEIREPRVAAGTVTVDGVLDDDTYADKTAAPWNEYSVLQNKGAPQPDLSGKFTARVDGDYLSVAVQVKGAIEPNILDSYRNAIANAGKLSANGAQADLYAQTGATTFRIWLRTNNEKRYLIDVQYLGEEIGWVATRAIFPAGSSLTWADLKVLASVDYADGVLTAEFAFPKDQFGVTDDFAMFVTYSDNFTDETYTDPTYQGLHLCSENAVLNADGYIVDYSGDAHTAPYVTFTTEQAAVEKITFSDTLNMAKLNYTNLGAAVVRAGLALAEEFYTPESWKTFADALAEAKDALNARARAITTQDEIDELAAKLLAAYDALELKGADYTAVDDALAKVDELDENNYTEESWKALQDAIANVDRDLKIDEQEKVAEMAKAIEDAIAALELKDADYSEVDKLLQIVDKMIPENYTEESWKALQDAIDAVVRGLKIDQQDDVDAMAEAIYNAIFDLVKADPSDDSSSDDTSSDDNSSDDNSSDDNSSDDTSSDDNSSDDNSSDDSSEESPSTPSEESPSNPSSSDSPETGDNGIMIFALLAVLSLAGAIVAVRVRH